MNFKTLDAQIEALMDLQETAKDKFSGFNSVMIKRLTKNGGYHGIVETKEGETYSVICKHNWQSLYSYTWKKK